MKKSNAKKHKGFIFIAVAVLLISAITAGIVFYPKDNEEDDIIWREYEVQQGDIVASFDGAGKVEFEEIPHSFASDLKIEKIFVEVGQEVKKGDKLVQYSKTEIEEKISELKQSLETAEIALDNAENALETSKLQKKSSDNQNLSDEKIKNKLDEMDIAAQNNAVKSAKAELNKIKAELKEAQNLLNTPDLTATAEGVVIKINYSEGDEVSAKQPVVSIGASDKKLVTVKVSQDDIGSVEVNQEVEMRFPSDPDQAILGKVCKKSSVPAEGSDDVNYLVTIAFDENQDELMQGMTCSVKFVLKKVENVLILANKAISLKDGKQFVTVKLADGTHEQREIETGFSDGRISEIKNGLANGDIVVVAG